VRVALVFGGNLVATTLQPDPERFEVLLGSDESQPHGLGLLSRAEVGWPEGADPKPRIDVAACTAELQLGLWEYAREH